MTPQSCLLTPQLQALLGAVAASALKLDFAALQPRCACSLRLLAAMSCRLRRCCLQWCKCCGHFSRGCDAGVQSLSHSTLQSTSNILATAQGLPLEQGGSASQAVTALAAEVRENVKLRQIRWCVRESRLHRLLGSACRFRDRLAGPDLVFGAYAHGGPSRVAGRIGSLVALHTTGALMIQLMC